MEEEEGGFVSIQNITTNANGTIVSLTLSKAAWLLAAFPYSTQWKDQNEFNYLTHAVTNGLKEAKEQHAAPVSVPELVDPRSLPSFSSTSLPVAVYTDYPAAKEVLSRSSIYKLVESSDEADFLLVTAHITDFLSLSLAQRVCQFPYEGGLVRKDLLLLTVPRHCQGSTGGSPEWWLPCFDMSTQFHLFADFFRQSSLSGQVDSWIIKPSQGTRGKGHRIIPSFSLGGGRDAAVEARDSDEGEEEAILSALKSIALASPLLPNAVRYLPQRESRVEDDGDMDRNGQDHVIQLLVQRPLLVKGRKFDLRLFVFVRSFSPFEAYMHELFYARLANKPYDLTQLCDSEVSLTVSAYHRDKSVSARQERLLSADLRACLCSEDPLFSYPDMMRKVEALLSELFGGAARSIGRWPRSSAYYAVDVILQDNRDSGNPQGVSPKLLEVNFMGDWLGVKNALSERFGGPDSGEAQSLYLQWVEDMLGVLATSADLTSHPRLKRLNIPNHRGDEERLES